MFCDNGIPFIIAVILCPVIWIAVSIFIGKIFPIGGIIFGVASIAVYFEWTVSEFSSGHTIHGTIAVAIVVVAVLGIVKIMHDAAVEEEKRKVQIEQIPGRIERYISENGYTSVSKYINYCDVSNEFQTAREIKYTNPLYTQQVEENKRREQNKQKPLEITEPSLINYGQFSSFKYREIVLSHLVHRLPEIIKSTYMFDYYNLYEFVPDFKEFFIMDNGNFDSAYFQQAAIGTINECINSGIISRVGNSDVFKSKVIPEEEGNIVEGETIEISLD